MRKSRPSWPDIRIHCPCSEKAILSGNESTSSTATLAEVTASEDDLALPRTVMNDSALYSLNNIYFCEECSSIRCPKCVFEEVVQVYCPSCLHVYMSEFDDEPGQRSLVSMSRRKSDREYQMYVI